MTSRLKNRTWVVVGAVLFVLLVAGLQMAGGSVHPGRSDPDHSSMAATAASRAGIAPARVSRTGGRLPTGTRPGPEKVVAGVYVANIQKVDLSSNSFDADFYVWLRWRDPEVDPTEGLEIMNTYQTWGLVTTPVFEKPEPQPDGSLVWLVRYQGSFNAPMSLADYPFEEQTLRILIEDGKQNVKQIVYEPDKDPIGLDREVTLAGYNFGQPQITFGEYTYESAFGNVGLEPQDRTYPRIVVEIPLSSPAISGIVKIILPVIIMLVAAALGLVIPAEYVDSKVNVPITALIALVAMHFVVSMGLPDVSYLVMIDLVYLLAYCAVTVMLAGAVLGAWVLKSRGEEAAMALERRFLLIGGVAFLVCLVAVFLAYLPDSLL